MTTAVLLGLTLAFEPREPGIMRRSPRLPGIPILTGEFIFRIVLVGSDVVGGVWFVRMGFHQGASEDKARTIAVNVFAVGQSFYLLNCRSLRLSMFRLGVFGNPWVWAGIAAMTAAQLLFTYSPLDESLVPHCANWADGLGPYRGGWPDDLSGHRTGKNIPAAPEKDGQQKKWSWKLIRPSGAMSLAILGDTLGFSKEVGAFRHYGTATG